MATQQPETYYETRFVIENPPCPSRFAVVTAHNPMDRKRSSRINNSSDHRLRRLLCRQGLRHFRITGCSPDQSHSEAGWGIETDMDTAIKIARRYRQRAIWWVDDNKLFLVDCSNPEPELVSDFSSRIL